MTDRNINIYLSEDLHRQLLPLIWEKKVSRFIKETVAEKLAKEQKKESQEEFHFKRVNRLVKNMARLVDYLKTSYDLTKKGLHLDILTPEPLDNGTIYWTDKLGKINQDTWEKLLICGNFFWWKIY